MLTIPTLLSMSKDFCTQSNEQIQENYYWFSYLYLLAIFVSLTNQVSEGFGDLFTTTSSSSSSSNRVVPSQGQSSFILSSSTTYSLRYSFLSTLLLFIIKIDKNVFKNLGGCKIRSLEFLGMFLLYTNNYFCIKD